MLIVCLGINVVLFINLLMIPVTKMELSLIVTYVVKKDYLSMEHIAVHSVNMTCIKNVQLPLAYPDPFSIIFKGMS